MNHSSILAISLAALLPAIPACGDDNNPGGDATSFSANLSGTGEVPALPERSGARSRRGELGLYLDGGIE